MKWARLSAWIVIQALLFVQILPPGSALADTLRAQSTEGRAQAGLEEQLIGQPSRGFTSRVARVTEGGVQVARRSVGKLQATVTWDLQGGTLGEPITLERGAGPSEAEQVTQQVARVMEWAQAGLAWLRERESATPWISRILNEAGPQPLNVEFRANHGMTVDLFESDRTVRLDTTIASEFQGPRYYAARPALYGTGLFHSAALAAGYSPRQAAHWTLALYETLPPDQQQELLRLLRLPVVDHGNTWALFFEEASKPPVDPVHAQQVKAVDTLTLEARAEQETEEAERASLAAVVNHRDKMVSWLMGQQMIDLPYDRLAMREAMRTAERNVEAGRAQAYEAVRRFDPSVERENAERVGTLVREEWVPDRLPYPTLLAGRASRAFGNQAYLMASAVTVETGEEVRSLAQALETQSRAEHLLGELEALERSAPPAARSELRGARDGIAARLVHLGPGIARVRLLASGQAAALTQYKGALQQVRENVTVFYREASATIERARQRASEAPGKGVRRVFPGKEVSVPFEEAQVKLSRFAGQGGRLVQAVNHLESEILKAPAQPAAYSVLLQRPSPTGSINFNANELAEKPEQEPALRELVRLGGQNSYISPTLDWVAEATDVIEAAPLFIYERTVELEDGKTVTVFEVDQEGLDETVRQMADYWALNIDRTMDSEHLALAREIIVSADGALLRRAGELTAEGISAETAHRRILYDALESRPELLREVGSVAAWLAAEFDRRIQEVERYTEQEWRKGRFVERMESLRGLVVAGQKPAGLIRQAQGAADRLKAEVDRLTPLALRRRRPMPAFHLLTTEAPGLVQGFFQAVLEEEMALRNVVRARGLEKEVGERIGRYEQRIADLGQTVIREFGYGPIVEQNMLALPAEVQGEERQQRAVQRTIADHLRLQQELARLAVLAEFAEAGGRPFDRAHPDPEAVDRLIADQRGVLEPQAARQVWQRNRLDPDLAGRVNALDPTQTSPAAIAQAIREIPIYAEELESTIRWQARQQVLEQLSQEHPELHLQERADRWYRDHSALAQTTARREAIHAHGHQALLMDPRYAYSNGALKETPEGHLRPTGARKRYHLVYGPSRVNLGAGERDSVEVWPQWVGVTDPLAASHALAFYQRINFNPEVRTILEAENLKVSENQWTAMVRAVRNAEAYFVGRLGVGDIEDLAHQFNRRGGLPGAWLKDGETYAAGPTTGYCIPKDLLFKLFVSTAQDSRKMGQIGIPEHLHAGVLQMVSELLAAQDRFDTVTEWEAWAAQEMLSPESLEKRFSPAEAKELSSLFSQYVSVTGGAMVFHLTRLLQILQMVGIPSPMLVPGKDLHAALWAQWADLKLTLPAEQVNRSLVFPMTREIPDGVAESRQRNPGVRIAGPGREWVHFFGTYKGDDREPPPPDVRYSWIMRSFMILSGYGREVALSLDEDGQILARLSWDGFQPDSNDPEDQKVVRFLAQRMAGKDRFGPEEAALVGKLKADFPAHTTVGHITITVVPGVSADDLLGFSKETQTLLGSRAAEVRELIQSQGINAAQIAANAQSGRLFPQEWVPLSDLSPAEQAALYQAVGGGVHPLVLQTRGPGTDFKRDLQGQDVAVFSVTHPEIVVMDPSELRDLMQLGRPGGLQSALVAIDVVAQGRHRVWFDRDVMLWYAAARGIDSEGRPIERWSDRDAKGRRSVYKAFGFGEETYRPLLGTDLRQEVRRQELRAAELFEALRAVADSDEAGGGAAVERFQQTFSRELPAERLRIEAQLAVQYEQAMLSFRRNRPRDRLIRESLVALASGKPATRMDAVDWLAVGGIFLVNGAPESHQGEVLSVLDRARQKMAPAAGMEEAARVGQLIRPRLVPSSLERTERKGEMFSVKAGETLAERAVARRKGLALQAARQAALKAREEGFRSIGAVTSLGAIPAALMQARQAVDGMSDQLESGAGIPAQMHYKSGQVMGAAAAVFKRLNEALIPDADERKQVNAKIQTLSRGRELDAGAWSAFGGTYEDPGILARLFELAGPERRPLVAAAMELLYLSLLMDKSAEFSGLAATDVDEKQLWRALAVYYAETIDDHYHEYNPWAFDPKRGAAFVDYYNELGILRPERREELYGLSWTHHRTAYRYIRALVRAKTSYGKLFPEERAALLGQVRLAGAPEQDELEVQAIGAGAPGRQERLWRAYNQYREIAFLHNDGFATPAVFDRLDPHDPAVLDAGRRLNFAFVAPVGRTHYSRALLSAGLLGANLFITRDAAVHPVPGSKGPVATLSDAHFWMTEAQYREALIRFRGMSRAEADQQIGRDRKAGRLTPHGIRVAARFTKPVVIASGVVMHHHSLEPEWIAAGYPATDKEPMLYAVTYDKSLYPDIYNPADRTGVHLPPEIDWLAKNTQGRPEPEVKAGIAAFLEPFAREHGVIVVKGAAESGARNFKRFDLIDSKGWNGQQFQEAVDFIYHVSRGQNVTIQRAILVTPIAWMDPAAVGAFVERQIRDWGVAVQLNRYPKDWVYGTQRIILSAGMPKDLNRLDDPANWDVSHPISLSSLQVATNVGRQGTLELLSDGLVRPEFRGRFIGELQEAGRRTMAAMARYGKRYWHEVYAPAYRAQHGEEPREFDAAGVPYWWPRYLMLDYLAEPVFGRNGQEVSGARVVDVIPGDPARSVPARFEVQETSGARFEAEILGFKHWLLEPNVGIGLWPNLWRREETHEKARAKAEERPLDWRNVGVQDRIVLGHYLEAGAAFLDAKFGPGHFGPGGGPTDGGGFGPAPAGPAAPSAPAAAEPFGQAIADLELEQGIHDFGPNQAAILLAEAALAALGGREALSDQDPQAILNQADQWLARPQIAEEYPRPEDNYTVPPEQAARWLADPAYRSRVAELVVDRVLSEPLAPIVEVAPEPLSPAELSRLLPHEATLAVVTGKRALMNHHVYPFEAGKGGRPVNVIGVHQEWLTAGGEATRLMVYNPETGRTVETALTQPLRFTQAVILELPATNEVQRHRELSGALESSGVRVVNRSGEAADRADDKAQLRQSTIQGVASIPTAQGVSVPTGEVVARTTAADRQSAVLATVAQESRSSGLVIQPRFGTTEGEGVAWFAPEDREGQARHLQSILERQDALVSVYRGNVTYSPDDTEDEKRPVVFRFNVAAGQAASASAVIGPPNGKIASLGQDGESEPLYAVLNGLRGPDGHPVLVTDQDWAAAERMAVDVASTLGLPLAGVDIVFETDAAGRLRPVVLEANVRPGTLILGEKATFSGGQPAASDPAPPVGDPFWDALRIPRTSRAPAAETAELRTLREWEGILANAQTNGFMERLRGRYGDDPVVLQERLEAYRQTIAGALANGFDPDGPVAMVASVGRDRVFMGHPDFPGLGAPSVNAATREEILAVVQATEDGQLHLANSDARYGSAILPVGEIAAVSERPEAYGTKVWEPVIWTSYLQGSLAFILSDRYAAASRVRERLGLGSGKPRGARFYVASVGELKLPDSGGMSSSSALTGAFSVGINALFGMGLTLEQLAEVDFGEYYVGKTAGAADKTAQLYAQRDQVVVVGSLPERFLGTVGFPQGLAVLMAEGPPRLVTPEGRAFLIDREGFSPEMADRVVAWANLTAKRRFGSAAFKGAVQRLREHLGEPALREQAGVTPSEAEAVERALMKEPKGHPFGLLRELAAGGAIEEELPDLAGWGNRHRRYDLIYRLLKLIPLRLQTDGVDLDLRKAALYGVSEAERGAAYLRELDLAVAAQRRGDLRTMQLHITRVLELVRWAQDGDRAVDDFRQWITQPGAPEEGRFAKTAWASDPRNDVSDSALDAVRAALPQAPPTDADQWVDSELFKRPGGFERSTADFDDLATEADRRFNRKIAMRVAAFGMRGTMAVHADASDPDGEGALQQAMDWLRSIGWTVRVVRPGAPTQLIQPPTAGMEEGRVILLAPEVAVQPLFAALSNAPGVSGRAVKVIAFARGEGQRREIEAGLGQTTLRGFEVIDIEEPPYHGNLGEAIVDQQVRFLDDGLAVQPVYSLDELEGLGRFLRMPDSSARSWAEGIRDQVLGRQL